MTREITHMKAFTAALESMGKPPFSIGQHPPDSGPRRSVFQRFHWHGRPRRTKRQRALGMKGPDFELVEAPAFKAYASQEQGTRQSNGGGTRGAGPRILKKNSG